MQKSSYMFVVFAAVFLAACGPNTPDKPATAPGGPSLSVSPKALQPDVAKQWVNAVKNHATADGSTVEQVLHYAQNSRAKVFKYKALSGEDDIGYSGATGEPSAVSITYWIGSKRDVQSSYVDLGYDMTPGGAIVLPGAGATAAVLALEAGRQAFVKWIDEAYENDCRDASTKKLVC